MKLPAIEGCGYCSAIKSMQTSEILDKRSISSGRIGKIKRIKVWLRAVEGRIAV